MSLFFSNATNNATDCEFFHPSDCPHLIQNVITLTWMGIVVISLLCLGYINQRCSKEKNARPKLQFNNLENVDLDDVGDYVPPRQPSSP